MAVNLASRTCRCVAIVPRDRRSAAASRPRGDRRSRDVLGGRASAVHGPVQRLQPHRPAGEGARDRAGRPGHGGLPTTASVVVDRAAAVLREIEEIAAEVAPRDGDRRRRAPGACSARRPAGCSPACSPALSRSAPPRAGDRLRGGARPAHPGCSPDGQRAIVHLPVDDPVVNIEPLFAEDRPGRGARHSTADRRGEIAAGRAAEHRLLLPPGIGAARGLDEARDRVASTRGGSRDRRRAPPGSPAVDGLEPAIVPTAACRCPRHLARIGHADLRAADDASARRRDGQPRRAGVRGRQG